MQRDKLLLGLLLLAPSSVSHAGSASAALSVTATVSGTCTISTTPVAFGAYDPVAANASAPADNTGAVVVTCTKGVVAPIGLDTGANATGGNRRMTNGTDFLQYELFQDAARTTNWGNSGSARYTPNAAPSNAPQTISVYARIPPGQNVGSGSYSDTVTATVNF